MRLIVGLLIMLTTLSACGGTSTTLEVTTWYAPPPGFKTERQRWQVQPSTLWLYRNEISSGPKADVANRHIFRPRNFSGGMCFEQRRNGDLVYMCTTRRYLDQQPFGQKLMVQKMPYRYCGLVAPVFFAGSSPYRCSGG